MEGTQTIILFREDENLFIMKVGINKNDFFARTNTFCFLGCERLGLRAKIQWIWKGTGKHKKGDALIT